MKLQNSYDVKVPQFVHLKARILLTASDEAMDEDELMVEWFELVNEKNELVRHESVLMYTQRQQEYEDRHAEVEYELRLLMAKPGRLSRKESAGLRTGPGIL